MGFDLNIENDVVTIEIAKQLKQMGFNKPTYYYYFDLDIQYVKRGLHSVKIGQRRMNHNRYDEFVYSAPTKNDAEKWIKNKK